MSKPFTHLRLTRPLAVLDVETTGTSPKDDRIIEIAIVKFLPDGSRKRYHRRLNPGIPIPAAATAVHGMTDRDVVDCPPFAAIAPSLVRFLRDCDLAGFHVHRFDLVMLLAEFNRAGVPFPLGRRAVIDALQICHQHEPRDLAAAVRHYLGRDHDGAHGALADAYATAAILDAQLARYADLPRTVAELHAHMTEVDLAGHFRRQDGRIIFAFGKYAGRPLEEVARRDEDYLYWMLDQDFLPDAKALVTQALAVAVRA